MKFLVVFATVILAASALSATHHWENFKVKHNKTYKSSVEESIRYGIFRDNVQLINEHNARYALGLETYTMAVNKFADLSAEEFKNKLNLQTQNKPAVNGDLHVFSEAVTAPDSVDWREKGAVLEVKDQGQCGSCWAFSATGAIEGQNILLNGKSLSLSEQQLLDCSGDYGNGDCDYGGLMTSAFEYIKDHGIESEADYPYETVKRTCRVKTEKTALNIKGYKELPANEEALKNAVGTIGPISVAMYAEPIQFYDQGIFESKDCVKREDYLDHGVLAVGYGVEGDKPFWIIKNSWGASWGEQGFFRLARNSNNQCGISTMTSYPLL